MSDTPVLTKELKFCRISEFLQLLSTTHNKKEQDKYADKFFNSLKLVRQQFIDKNGFEVRLF
jgi:hypothetical protein